jgi:hypothetical protein
MSANQHKYNYVLIKSYLEQLLNAPAGSLSLSTIEKNLGAKATYSGSFDITGLAGLTPGAPVLIQQSAGPYTGKGTLADESEDMITANAYVLDSATIRVYWQAVKSPVMGNIKFNYSIG